MTAEQLAAVRAACEAWKGTPFHHAARVRGVGVDCANLLIGVYGDAGLVPPIRLGDYPQAWMLHRDRERFVEQLSEHADEVREAELAAGDTVLMRYARCFSHAAIYLGERVIFHAYVGRAAGFDHLDAYMPRAMRFFRLRSAA